MMTYFGVVPEGHILDVPNAVLGSIYYAYILILSSMFPLFFTYFATMMAMSSSVFLAYQLTFVVKELCIICWSTHVLNTLLSWNLITNSSSSSSSSPTKKKKTL